jgi:hypothetical protein
MSADRLYDAERVFREALSRVRRNFGNGAFTLHDVAMLVARRGRIDGRCSPLGLRGGVLCGDGSAHTLIVERMRGRMLALLADQTHARSPGATIRRGPTIDR